MPNERLRVAVQGAVQGVGFRPFVHRLASEMSLAGWVCNDAQGVVLEVEGPSSDIRCFLLRLNSEPPPHAVITGIEPTFLEAAGYEGFHIRSSQGGAKTAFVLPDIATCADCLRELFDPRDRRYRYPFINCTHCGPRYTIVESLPYDRPRTTMRRFVMCGECRAEYENPGDRRFHAQPNACPDCGPVLELWDCAGRALANGGEALACAVASLNAGRIVAVKGIGGFHLWCDAGNGDAVRRLRARKRRWEKPFALMAPDIACALELCLVSELERRLLLSPEAPIVLLERREGAAVVDEVAPGNRCFGVMLPYSPLHHLLLRDFCHPVVATSGNLSEEPIVTDEAQALVGLGAIADLFLVHNRPIARAVDDSVVCVAEEREMLLRRARGYAPLPLPAGEDMPRLLAVGGHLKGAVAASVGRQVFISQHLGDLSTERSLESFRDAIRRLEALYDFAPEAVACDLHPDYASTHYAQSLNAPVVTVQHHHAHVLSCLADNGLDPPALGVAWDGSGYGGDGTVWGGEFLKVAPGGFSRAAKLREFRLPGGEQAVREPRRSALGLLYAFAGASALEWTDLAPAAAFTKTERAVLKRMLETGLSSPETTSAGRLFDAVAAMCGLRQTMTFEAQAAMDLEAVAWHAAGAAPYPFAVDGGGRGPIIVDWAPMLEALLSDLRGGVSAAEMASRFHAGLAESIVSVARRVGERKIALTGGCFQNRLLLSMTIRRLRAEGFDPCWHQRVPPNDGGLALGQAMAAAQALKRQAQCA